VLYVEDNVSNLTLVERILAHRPEVHVIGAMKGGLGLDLAFERRPDLILLDLDLPDIAGEEVLRTLKGDPRTKDLPVIVISADVARRNLQGLLAAGAREYLTKPLDVPAFLAVVDEVLGSG
jgi:CheY-like chemotaxis protein